MKSKGNSDWKNNTSKTYPTIVSICIVGELRNPEFHRVNNQQLCSNQANILLSFIRIGKNFELFITSQIVIVQDATILLIEN